MSTKRKKGGKCGDYIWVPEELLMEFIAEALQVDSFTEQDFAESISEIVVCNRQYLLFKFKNGDEKQIEWEERYLEWYEEQKKKAKARHRAAIDGRSPERKAELSRINSESKLKRSPEEVALSNKKMLETRSKWTPEQRKEISRKISKARREQEKAKREAKLAASASKESTD